MVPILVEIHLADGLLNMPRIMHIYPGRDSLSNYRDILKKYGYRMEQFNQTIHFYSNNPDELDNLYEEVLAELAKIETGVTKSRRVEETEEIETNLWNQKESWHLPEDGKRHAIDFSIPAKGPGKYIISATIRMFPDDKTRNPRVTAYFWYNDGTEPGKRILVTGTPIRKDGKPSVYSINMELKDPKVTHLRGWILDHSSRIGDWSKHVDVFGVKVYFITGTPGDS